MMRKRLFFFISLLLLWVALFTKLPFIDYSPLMLKYPECCSGQTNLFVYLCDYFLYELIGMNPNRFYSSTIRFFIYEAPKILLLLSLVVFVVGFIQSWFSPEKTRKVLEGKPLFAGNIFAATLGIFTPFCSCSAIPLFIGFIEAGIPIGVTFSFLIAAPMINEVAIVLLGGLFGWKIAAIYVGTGLIIAILSGFIIEKLGMKRYVADWVYQIKGQQRTLDNVKLTFSDRLDAGYNLVKEIIKKIWIYILIGIAVGAGVHGYVPDDLMASILGAQNWYSVPLAILVGVPLYSNAAGIIPIVSVLIEKGVSMGTALAFMMSVIALSFPEMVILKKVLKWQFIAIFIGIVATGIMLVGFIFNLIL
jgi:uncharacterized protein